MNYKNLCSGDAQNNYMGIGHNRQYSHITLGGERIDEKILGLGYLGMVSLTAWDFSLSH